MEPDEASRGIKAEVADAQRVIDSLNEKLHRKNSEISIIQTISTEINSTLDLDRIFEIILSTMDTVFGFRHSMILLADDAAQRLEVVASRGYEQSGLGAVVLYGKGMIGVVARKRKLMRMVNMATQMRYLNAMGAAQERIRLPGLPNVASQIAIPLIAKDRLIGVFAVESAESNAYDALDEIILGIVANQVAAAIDNARAYRAQIQLSEAYSRFVPREFLRFLDKKSILDVALGDQIERDMTVLFSDIRSFTALSERMTPAENFQFVNEYLGLVAPVIREHGGFIDKYVGDAIMALFPESPDGAVAAAVAMLARLERFNAGRVARGQAPIAIGVGLHTGRLMLGIIGVADHMQGTVIADSVNLASRLEGLTKEHRCPIIVSEAVRERLSPAAREQCRSLGAVKVKGKAQPVGICEFLGADPPARIEAKLRTRARFEQGVRDLGDERFDAAAAEFRELLREHPDDEVAQACLERCGERLAGAREPSSPKRG